MPVSRRNALSLFAAVPVLAASFFRATMEPDRTTMPDTRDFEDRRFYGRRKGRPLRKGQQQLIDTLLPRLAIALPDAGKLDPKSLFPHKPAQVWLEIGFGGGEHLAEQARANRDVGLIGCEVFLNGIATLLAQVSANALDNVRLYPEDARDLLDALPDGSLDRVFLLFPDPWPKRRHADRRFIRPANLDLLARPMKITPSTARRIGAMLLSKLLSTLTAMRFSCPALARM